MRQGFDLTMPERDHAMPRRSRVTPLVSALRMLQRLPGMFVSRQVILFSVLLLGGTVGVRGGVVQFCRPLVILIVRSIVITSRHQIVTICPDLLWASFASLYA